MTKAITLFVPDFAGAASGRNPFHVYLDACGYGIGAGLFQRPPEQDELLDYYKMLNVAPNSTKLEISEVLRDRKRHLSSFHSSELSKGDMANMEETLMDVEKRKAYDESLGLVKSRKDRAELRPLGLFSKS